MLQACLPSATAAECYTLLSDSILNDDYYGPWDSRDIVAWPERSEAMWRILELGWTEHLGRQLPQHLRQRWQRLGIHVLETLLAADRKRAASKLVASGQLYDLQRQPAQTARVQLALAKLQDNWQRQAEHLPRWMRRT